MYLERVADLGMHFPLYQYHAQDKKKIIQKRDKIYINLCENATTTTIILSPFQKNLGEQLPRNDQTSQNDQTSLTNIICTLLSPGLLKV